MKKTALKSVVSCTLALSLLLAILTPVSVKSGTAKRVTVNTGITVNHDGPHNVGIVY